jgi:hypothetical protein
MMGRNSSPVKVTQGSKEKSKMQDSQQSSNYRLPVSSEKNGAKDPCSRPALNLREVRWSF